MPSVADTHGDSGWHGGGIEQRQRRIEEGAGGAFGEKAGEDPGATRKSADLIALNEAKVALGRREGEAVAGERDLVRSAGRELREAIPPLAVGRRLGRLRAQQLDDDSADRGIVQIAHPTADRQGPRGQRQYDARGPVAGHEPVPAARD